MVACENTQPGDPPSDWQVSGAGDSTIQGFATSISVNVGGTVSFKVSTPATAYHIDVLRMGYYQGNGARKLVAGLKPTATLPQTQPACLNGATGTGLIDCGNWAVSASWAVPSTAVSGIYFAHLVRDDTGGSSLVPFVVRNDASHSDLLFQTSDETWQAYNSYGGNSLYQCTVNCPSGSPQAYKGASKVSYNRPFHTALDDGGRDWVMYTEYPMVRFLEANGYDVSYTSGLDLSTSGSLLLNHKAFLSVGHDEYWTGNQRANVENARAHGVSLAFFSGNEVFWKTRLENSIDSSAAANRTLVCYKETHYDTPVDPKDPPTWTGTWVDPRFSPPADGGQAQNALTGQLFDVNSGTTDIKVPAQYAKLRFWRNTAAANLTSGQSLTLGSGIGTLGYEWDEDVDDGFRPAGAIALSSTTFNSTDAFVDYGSSTGPRTVTHHLTLYRDASGSLIFGAGTVQWAWGLDSANPSGRTDVNMQQATVNLFADMGAQPASLSAGLVQATASADTTAPTSAITSPAAGATLADGAKITISGTATDSGGGVVGGMEVSTDGGATWHLATGTTSWSYTWIVHGSPTTTIRTRASDDSGNIETPSTGVTVKVGCPCSIWGTGVTPGGVDSGDGNSLEVGVRFTSDVAGSATGVRFYKASTNTGTHTGTLWSATGTKLASATFTNESGTGWQTVSFSNPVAVTANTTYVASYFAPNGHYSQDSGYMFPHASPAPDGDGSVDSPPLHALRDTGSSVNDVYAYSATSTFPTQSFNGENYWVDVVFQPSTGATTPLVTSVSPSDRATSVATSTSVTATFNESVQASSIIFTLTSASGAQVAGTNSYDDTTHTATFKPTNALANATTYTATVSGAKDAAGTSMAPFTWTFTAANAPGTCPCTIWPASATPATASVNDASAVEVGVKFSSDTAGTITGIRFYKGSTNTGTHTGTLWSATGTKLATATFTSETATGWQQVTFATPVTITANTTYVASYHTNTGNYAANGGGLTTAVDNPPLHAVASGTSGGNGVYAYGTTSTFPTNTFNDTNYWVDVVFSP